MYTDACRYERPTGKAGALSLLALATGGNLDDEWLAISLYLFEIESRRRKAEHELAAAPVGQG